jgi:hypothetical protein
MAPFPVKQVRVTELPGGRQMTWSGQYHGRKRDFREMGLMNERGQIVGTTSMIATLDDGNTIRYHLTAS